MADVIETRCNDPDCTFPDCNCWEVKRRNCPTRIPKLEDALRFAKSVIAANGDVRVGGLAIKRIDEALKY